jgi:hypothetical protein
MKKSLKGALLLSLAVAPGFTATLLFQGNFAADNQVALFNITGDVLTLTNGTCLQVGLNATTGNCDDIFYQNLLQPGTFTLGLAVLDNSPVGLFVTDGFVQDGNPGFTCQEAGTGGSFCDVTTALGTSRTGNYAISITGADSVTTPEPGSILLLFAGGALVAFAAAPLQFTTSLTQV